MSIFEGVRDDFIRYGMSSRMFFLRIGCLFVQSLFVRISGLHEIPLYNKTPSVVVLTPCTFPSVI